MNKPCGSEYETEDPESSRNEKPENCRPSENGWRLHDARVKGSEEFRRYVDEFRKLRLEDLLPLHLLFEDQPWNLLWIRWLAFFALFPLLFATLFAGQPIQLDQAAWVFCTYFAMVWLVVLAVFMRPQRMRFGLVEQIGAFTVLFGTALVLQVQNWFPFSLIYAAARLGETTPQRLLGFIFGVGIVEEAVKTLPILLFVYRKRLRLHPLTYAYLGVVSGLAFSIPEGVNYSIQYSAQLAQIGPEALGSYIVVLLLRLITLPLIHAIATAISAYFVGLAALHRVTPRALITVGLAIAAVLHGSYDTFSGVWLGFTVVAGALLLFVSYVRNSDMIEQAILHSPKTECDDGEAASGDNGSDGPWPDAS